MFEKYVNEMTSQLSAQKDRHELLKDVAKTYFADYDKRMERASELHEGEKNPNSPEELLELRDYFKQMADDMRSTITTFHGSKEQFANVINSLDVAAKATENYAMFPDETSLMKFDKAISEMKKANEAYIEYKQDNVNGKTAKTRLGMARTLLGKIDDISASFQKHPKPKLDKGNKLRAEIRNMAETFQSDKLTVDQLKTLQASFTTYAKDNQAKMKKIAEAMPNKNSQLYRLINETANLNPPNFFSYLGRLNMAKDMAMKEHTTDPKMEQCLSQIKDLASKNMENLNGSAKSIQKRFEMHEKTKTNDAPVL